MKGSTPVTNRRERLVIWATDPANEKKLTTLGLGLTAIGTAIYAFGVEAAQSYQPARLAERERLAAEVAR